MAKENLNEENLDTGAEGAEGTEQKVDLEAMNIYV